MTRVDQYGLELTTDSAVAADAYVEALALVLSGRAGAADRITVALDADPDFALAHAMAAVLERSPGNRERSIARILFAAHSGRTASRRERQLIGALRRIIVGDRTTARELADVHLQEFPRDVLLLRERVLIEAPGDVRRKARMAELLGLFADHLGSDPWFVAVYGQALSEIGDLTASVRMVERALAANPDHAYLAHSRAHSYFEAGDDTGGRELLSRWIREYGESARNVGHMTWHLALTHLANAEPDVACALYRDHVGAPGWHGFRMRDAVSLLWRLHIRGVDVGREWDAIDEGRLRGATNPFELAHVAFALIARGDIDGVHRIRRGVATLVDSHPALPYEPLLPLVDALVPFAEKRWTEAGPALEEAALSARRLGGSNEQHTLFDETTAVAYRRAGREDDARRVEREQLQGRAVEPIAVSRSELP